MSEWDQVERKKNRGFKQEKQNNLQSSQRNQENKTVNNVTEKQETL